MPRVSPDNAPRFVGHAGDDTRLNRWIRLALQSAFGLALLALWVRTVSLADVVSHIRVQRWWLLPLMAVFFLIASGLRARRWQWLLRSLAHRPPNSAGADCIGGGRPGLRVPSRRTRALDPCARGAPGRADRARPDHRRLQLHAAVRGGWDRRAGVEGDGRVSRAPAEL